MPRFDTSFNFGANAPAKRKAKPARSKAAKRPKAGKSKSRKHFATMHGS